jgi:hypothetical protein
MWHTKKWKNNQNLKISLKCKRNSKIKKIWPKRSKRDLIEKWCNTKQVIRSNPRCKSKSKMKSKLKTIDRLRFKWDWSRKSKWGEILKSWRRKSKRKWGFIEKLLSSRKRFMITIRISSARWLNKKRIWIGKIWEDLSSLIMR